MSTTRKLMVFGPSDTLERMSKVILEASAPQYHYSVNNADKTSVNIMVYEEHNKLMNSSISVTLLLHYTGTSIRADVISTGGRMGFRGSNPEGETPLNEAVTDYILDYGKRFGLTVQDVSEK
ncbi:MAG: hypothetical protein JJU41_08025 [Bacteroidetes bacterium]|nr:hypothetical protein [Bacteroidota bacterium]MCH8523320.1 hypothetical protein [Balneolales bacterium]